MNEQTKKRIGVLGIHGYLNYKISAVLNKQFASTKIFGERLKFRPIKSDLDVITTVLLGELECLRKRRKEINRKQSIIVDAGAHVGMSAIWLAHHFPLATVVAIEPEFENFSLLKYNTRNYDNIFPICAALISEKNRQQLAELNDRNTGPWGYSIAGNGSKTSQIIALVPTISISQIRHHFAQPIACIKLDIEGAEADLFLHDAEVMNSIPAVVVELHDRIIEGTTDAFRQCFLNANISNEGLEKYLVTRN